MAAFGAHVVPRYVETIREAREDHRTKRFAGNRKSRMVKRRKRKNTATKKLKFELTFNE